MNDHTPNFCHLSKPLRDIAPVFYAWAVEDHPEHAAKFLRENTRNYPVLMECFARIVAARAEKEPACIADVFADDVTHQAMQRAIAIVNPALAENARTASSADAIAFHFSLPSPRGDGDGGRDDQRITSAA